MQTQTKIPSGSLQVQKGRFHMVIHMEREGKMTPVWRTTGLPAEERYTDSRRKEKIRRTGGKDSPSGTADGGRLSAGVVPVCPSQSGPGDPHQL